MNNLEELIDERKLYTCCHCGEEDLLEEFDLDLENNQGYWCSICEGFTYFEGKENFKTFKLYLEVPGTEEMRKSRVKFNKRLSPLRYPGGKAKMIGHLYETYLRDKEKKIFVEPFCGGSAVGLSLLEAGVVESIVLNDKDYGVYALFNTILNDPEALIEKISNHSATRDDFFIRRIQIEQNYEGLSELEAGFSLLVVNRMAYSGIVKANPKGNLTERWNPTDIIKRIRQIHKMNDRIKLMNIDACELIGQEYWDSKNFLFVDPPYFVKGDALYNTIYADGDHYDLAHLLTDLYYQHPGCADIVVTYDNVEYIRKMYIYAEDVYVGRNYSIAN